MKKAVRIISAVILLISLTSCNLINDTEPVVKTGFAFDTVVSLTLYECGEDTADSCFSYIEEFEKQFSPTVSDSELYKYNSAVKPTDGSALLISEPLAELIGKCLGYSKLTEGAYDITIRPITSLWDFHGTENRVPETAAITHALEKVGYEHIKELTGDSVSCDLSDLEIDLGSAAKGYIADKASAMLKGLNVSSGIINLGGSITCIGSRPDGSPFKIGVQMPFGGKDDYSVVLNINDMSVVTAGIYERCFTENGKLYHHILDPFTGYPVESELASVTVISANATDADILSTVCFCIPEDDAVSLIESLKNTYAMFLHKDGTARYSKNFEKFLND